MSTTEELLRLRYELNILVDSWTAQAKQLDTKAVEYAATYDFANSVLNDAAAIRFRYCAQQLKDVLDA